MLTAALVLGAIGLVAALMLGVAAKLFAVYVDPNVTAIEEELPGRQSSVGMSAPFVEMSGVFGW